jgi:hypothetical protein
MSNATTTKSRSAMRNDLPTAYSPPTGKWSGAAEFFDGMSASRGRFREPLVVERHASALDTDIGETDYEL